MNGGRPAPVPNLNPHAHSHEALKEMTDTAQPAGAQAVADGWAQLAAGFDEAVELFDRAMAESRSGWTGAAADAMRAHLAKVAGWSRAMGAHYQAASAAIGTQAQAAESAKSAMPPPVPYDPAAMIRQARDSGNILEMAMLPFQLYDQKRKHDEAHDEAARVVSERDQSFGRSAADIPPFEPPPSLADGGPVPGAPGHNPSHATVSAAAAEGPDPLPPGSGPAPVTTTPAGATTPSGAAAFVAGPGQAFGPASPSPLGFGGFGPGGSLSFPATPVPRGRAGFDDQPAIPTEEAKPKRPQYMLEPELGGMFGGGELTSPPVIGEA